MGKFHPRRVRLGQNVSSAPVPVPRRGPRFRPSAIGYRPKEAQQTNVAQTRNNDVYIVGNPSSSYPLLPPLAVAASQICNRPSVSPCPASLAGAPPRAATPQRPALSSRSSLFHLRSPRLLSVVPLLTSARSRARSCVDLHSLPLSPLSPSPISPAPTPPQAS
jgi:hypothetical protein